MSARSQSRSFARVATASFALAWALACIAARPPAAAAEEPSIVAELSPREIRPGETARLVVRISGTRSAAAPNLPPIDGLDPGSRSQQTSFSIVNGSMSSEVVYSWSLLAMREGDFVIPPLQVDVGGTTLSTEALSLRVLATGQAPQAAAPGAGAAAGDANASGTAPEDAPEVAGLEIRIPDRELFVGESVPGTLRLLIREGVRVSDVEQPQIVGDAFTVTRPSDRQPDQTTTSIGGRTYHVLSFPIAVSPIRPGVHDLAASEVMHAVLPRARDRRRGGPDEDPFSDPFFSGFFGEPRKLDVKARPLVLRVLPLPAEGRPADFSGAIGRFVIDASASPTSVAQGDPITQRVTIRGEGNLDRVDLAPLATDAAWKVYPGTSRIETSDPLGVRGAKVFEQAIVPQRADLTALPPRRFSYFDPAARGYVSLETQPVAIAVAPP
ncbi:MAG: BatD family protein, partial [Alphaproteobacteria bacterium]